MRATDIIQLVQKWEEFEKDSKRINLEQFAYWLLQHTSEPTDRIQQERTTGYLLFRFERFTKAQIKQLFQDLPLIGYDDFILLNTVFHQSGISKKELYERNIYDMNSGTQVVKRLIREGLLEDFQSETDKRVYLLQITTLGKEVRNTAFERLGMASKKKFQHLSKEELDQLHHMIQKMLMSYE